MKCVCPMGGDRVCPDDCLLRMWHGLPDDQRTKERRRLIVEQLHKQRYSQQQIASQLNVSQYTVCKDLEALLVPNNAGRLDKLGRKNEGRPKNKKEKKPKQRGEAPLYVKACEIVRPIIAAEKPLNVTELARAHGISRDTFERAVNAEEKLWKARQALIADPIVERAALSLSAQQKLDAALRQYKHKLSLEFSQAVNERVRERMDEIILPDMKKKIDEAHEIYARRKGFMTKDTFNTIRRALHPDSRNSVSDKKLAEAFDAFMALEKYLLNEKDSPTSFGFMPSTLAEWDRMRAAATAARKKQSKSDMVRRA